MCNAFVTLQMAVRQTVPPSPAQCPAPSTTVPEQPTTPFYFLFLLSSSSSQHLERDKEAIHTRCAMLPPPLPPTLAP